MGTVKNNTGQTLKIRKPLKGIPNILRDVVTVLPGKPEPEEISKETGSWKNEFDRIEYASPTFTITDERNNPRGFFLIRAEFNPYINLIHIFGVITGVVGAGKDFSFAEEFLPEEIEELNKKKYTIDLILDDPLTDSIIKIS